MMDSDAMNFGELGQLDGYFGEDEFAFNELDAPIPEGLDEPAFYWLAVMPIAPRKQTEGGLILPSQVRDAESFMNALGRVVAIGEGAFKSAKIRTDLQCTRVPEIGEIIRYSGVRNREYKFKGVTLIDVMDSQVRAYIKEENVRSGAYQFWR